MKIYNTLHHKLEEFKPLSKIVKIYTCGPTVYGFQHIGNYASYIYWDLLIRTLKANHYQVQRILNFTDVGHLTSDADTGEDKMEKTARKENKSVFEIAQFYGDDFLRNFRMLNLLEPDKIARATNYIEQDKQAVNLMSKNGFTYETTDGIYFDTSKFANYAKFAKLDLEHLQAGARVELSPEKKHPSDFAVWKFIQPNEKHAMRWDYLNRPGYPGWHLECSTIIHTEFKEPIDIHTGGIDHIPVHHTNEIAQTFALSGKPLAKYWLHCNFITINGQKISKSIGNIYTIDDLSKAGFSPMDFKMWVLQGHFQGERNFTFDSLSSAQTRRLNWRNRIALTYQKPLNQKLDILPQLNQNLNSPTAFALIDATPDLSFATWQHIDNLLGLNLIQDAPPLSPQLTQLISQREAYRQAKNWQMSDQLRTQLEQQGITIKDTSTGPFWQYCQ